MKDCTEIRERLSAFIDNELPPQESRLIEKHINECPACSKEVNSLRQIIDLLDEFPDESPSLSFTPATIQKVSSWKRCSYVKEHILLPALAVLRSALSLALCQLEVDAKWKRTPFNAYLRSFDDFPPESLSSVYISLIQGEST
jgi:anti-sigma factor RsiW